MYVSHMLLCACSTIIPTNKILMQKPRLIVALDFFTSQSIVLDHVLMAHVMVEMEVAVSYGFVSLQLKPSHNSSSPQVPSHL